MKKIMLATTALVATAGFAQAEVAVTGFAEVGIVGGDLYATDQFHQDIDVFFTMTGEADNGLTFGAKVDLDELGAFGATTQGGETYFVAYGGFRADFGDTDGAFDAALTETAIGGTLADDHTIHFGYNGNGGLDGVYDGQISRFSYAFNSFTGHLSVELDDTGVFDPIYGLGAAYSGDLGGVTLGVGIGYQTGDEDNSNAQIAITNVAVAAAVGALPPGASNEDVLLAALGAASHEAHEAWGISVSATLASGFQGILNYSERDFGDLATIIGGTQVDTEQHWAIGLGYTMNALTVGLNYGEYDDLLGVDGLSSNGYGLAVNYDLGGGLEVQAGYQTGDVNLDLPGFSASTTMDSYSLGLAMSF